MERIQTLKDRAKKSGYKIDPDQDLVKEVNSPNGYVILNEMINEKIRYDVFKVYTNV